MEENSLNYGLLCMQSGLYECVIPQLRAVVLNISIENKIFDIKLYYDGEISEKVLDLWDCAICEASSHFTYGVEQSIERLDYPIPIPLTGQFVYWRKESVFHSELIKPIFEKKLIDSMKKMPLKIFELLPQDFLDNIKATIKGYFLLIVQEALLGQVEPNLREVALEWKNSFLFVHFYYDQKISSSNEQSVENVMKHIKSYMHPKSYLEKRVVLIAQKHKLPVHQAVVYRRYELKN